MNAINLLLSQHREVEDLFASIDSAQSEPKKNELFEELADKLAIHASIEEHHLYPAVFPSHMGDPMLQSLEEHLALECGQAELLTLLGDDEEFEEAFKEFKEQFKDHIEAEETELFPKARRLLGNAELEAIGLAMSREQAELEHGNPPERVRDEIDCSIKEIQQANR